MKEMPMQRLETLKQKSNMAFGNDDMAFKEIEEDLSCSICFNILRNPKVLDCQHVYCLQCLQDWVGDQPTVACPECRQTTVVPKCDLKNLKTNLRVRSMVEKYAVRFDKVKSIPICATHEGERQHFFCVTCDTTVCRDCLVIKHPRNQHEIQELTDIVKQRKIDMKKKLEQVTDEVRKCDEDLRRLDEIKIQIERVQNQTECEIDRYVQDFCTQIQVKGQELKKQVCMIGKHHLQKVEDEKNHATERQKRLQNAYTATQNVVDTAANHVYIKQHAGLVQKMEKLCNTQYEVVNPDLMLCCHFQRGTDHVSSTWFGTVIENNHRPHEVMFTTEFGTFMKARSVAVTKSGLLAVVDSKTNDVMVYKDEHGVYKHQFNLVDSSGEGHGKLMKPLKVAVTTDQKFLVTDVGQVKEFSVTGQFESTKIIEGDRIAITPNNLIVLANSRYGNIKICTSNGELLKTHLTDSKNIADIATNGRQIAYTTGSEGKICVIDFETGEELWALDTIWPLGITFDPKSGNIMVAGHAKRRGQNVLKQYCGKCGYLISSRIRCLPNRLWNPYAMSVMQDGDILAVADLKTVKVFKLK